MSTFFDASMLAAPLRELTDTVESKVQAVRDLRSEILSEIGLIDHKINSALRTGESETATDREYRLAFREFLENPRGRGSERLKQAGHDLSKKDVTLTPDASGGYALPKIIQQGIYAQAYHVAPFLGLIGITQVASTDYRQVISRSDGSGARASALLARSGTTESTYRLTSPSWCEYYTFATVSEWAMDDIAGIEAHLAREAGSQIGLLVGQDVLTGNGTGQLKGLLNSTPAAIGDNDSPERTQEQLELVNGFNSPALASLYDAEVLVSRFQEEYLAGADFALVTRWSTWLAMIRGQFTDGQELISQRRPSLWGLPVSFSGLIDADAPGNFPIIAGAWNRGYQLLSRGPIRVIADEFSVPSVTSFRFRQRLGGCVRDNAALKVLKVG